jgi:hypothetical protein
VIYYDDESATKSPIVDFPSHFRVNFTEFDKNFDYKFVKLPASLGGKKQTTPSNIYIIDEATGAPKKFNLINEDVRAYFHSIYKL